MRVGVNILNFGPGASPAAFARWAGVAESLGYHSIMVSDHVAITPGVRQRYPEPFYDTFTLLAWLAAQTKQVQIGTTVVVLPYRHPVLTARLVANIDQLSGGRFIFGVGVGSSADEYASLRLPFKHRGTYGDECLRAIRALFVSDDPVTFRGKYVSFDEVAPMRAPQRPYPPVWVGGSSEAARRRAVRYGTAWHPFHRAPVASLRETDLPALRREAERAGRPVPSFCPRIRLEVRREAVAGERPAGVGSVDQVRQDLGELRELGAEHVILDWNTGDLEATRDHAHGFEMLARLADDVLDLERGTLK
jgi:probable F420-dependent oxidoreductase